MIGTSGAPLSGDHRAQLYSDAIHGGVIIIVVISATILASVTRVVSSDTLSAVYLGAIGYAAGRAGQVQRTRSYPDGEGRR